jgi:hypothetical protein
VLGCGPNGLGRNGRVFSGGPARIGCVCVGQNCRACQRGRAEDLARESNSAPSTAGADSMSSTTESEPRPTFWCADPLRATSVSRRTETASKLPMAHWFSWIPRSAPMSGWKYSADLRFTPQIAGASLRPRPRRTRTARAFRRGSGRGSVPSSARCGVSRRSAEPTDPQRSSGWSPVPGARATRRCRRRGHRVSQTGFGVGDGLHEPHRDRQITATALRRQPVARTSVRRNPFP